eukprot:NODE_400_length_8090_cov_0.771522.p5 type:complete len:142 gc:universal NODE_400_length_8090_cov_0.771522:831-406(-)
MGSLSICSTVVTFPLTMCCNRATTSLGVNPCSVKQVNVSGYMYWIRFNRDRICIFLVKWAFEYFFMVDLMMKWSWRASNDGISISVGVRVVKSKDLFIFNGHGEGCFYSRFVNDDWVEKTQYLIGLETNVSKTFICGYLTK